MIKILLWIGLVVCSTYSLAGDMSESSCNFRRAISRVPGVKPIINKSTHPYSNPSFEKYCYSYAQKIIRKAISHDNSFSEAEGVFETILIVNPESVYPHIGFADLVVREYELNISNRSLFYAYKKAELATRIKPVFSGAFVTLGRVELLLNCLLCAELSVKKARELGNSSPELALLQSSIYLTRNNILEAKAELTEALSRPSVELTDEIQMEIHLRLASLNALLKNYVEAEIELNKAIEIDPVDPAPYIAKAEYFLNLVGNGKEAADTAIKANQIKPTIMAKRIQSFSEYLAWATSYLDGKKTTDIKRLLQTSFVTPEEVFVVSARYIGLSKITEAMLKAKIINNIETQDSQGNTALIAANIGNNVYLAKLLIDRHANVNAQNRNGERALSFSVLNENKNVVTWLLKAGAEVNFIDAEGNSPLSLALLRQSKLIFNQLVEHRASMLPVVDLAKKLGIDNIEKLVANLRPTSI